MHDRRPLRIASAIAPIDAGLLTALESVFTRRTSIVVKREVLAAGAALDLAKRGGIDAVISHTPILEERFVAGGWGLGRYPFAAIDFLIVGPADDPARAHDSTDSVTALRCIANSGALFLSRDDRPSAKRLEQELWTAAGIEPDGTPWYCTTDTANSDGAAVAREAAKLSTYTLLERATHLTARPQLTSITENDPHLLSVFSAVPVNPRRAADVNEGGAEAFLDWLLGDEAQALVGAFRLPEHRTTFFLRREQIPHIALRCCSHRRP